MIYLISGIEHSRHSGDQFIEAFRELFSEK